MLLTFQASNYKGFILLNMKLILKIRVIAVIIIWQIIMLYKYDFLTYPYKPM